MRLSFPQKLWLPLVLSLLCFVGLATVNAYRTREIRLEERRGDLAHTTELALAVVAAFADQSNTGNITLVQAKNQAMNTLRKMRYGGSSGYFSVINSDGILLPHPDPALQGRDMHLNPDIRTRINLIKSEGRGFAPYLYVKPGGDNVPKLSYTDAYKPWDWIVSTGIDIADFEAAFRTTLIQSLGFVALVGALLSLVIVILNRGILGSLGGEPAYAAQIATRIAENDLTVLIETTPNDRVSLLYSMTRMQDHLASTIRLIRSSADSIATATSQIAAGNHDLSQRTEQQAASLQETAASMEELTTTVNDNAENARQASQVASQAVEVAQRGTGVDAKVIETMDGITESSDKISDIVSLIEGIAFQTNILALNAAVEAARAGEHGRGFAVVAAEVRSLAQRASAASREIKALIEHSLERVRLGAEFVDAAGATMNDITQAIRRVTDIIGEIASASVEQSRGIGEVSHAVMEMDSVTQQNAAPVEEAAAAASSLALQAGTLKSSMAAFRLD